MHVRSLLYPQLMRDYRPGPSTRAFADESFQEDSAGGFYVVAAAVFAEEVEPAAREELIALRGSKRGGKLHWNDLNTQQRHNVSKKIVELEGFHVVVVGTPVPPKRQERARAKCLRQLVFELHSYGVVHLLMEARSQQLNLRDVRTVAVARQELAKGSEFQIGHIAGHDEPLLWAADVVAGAVRASHEGHQYSTELLNTCVYEIELNTDC